jgi:hypothetical protein
LELKADKIVRYKRKNLESERVQSVVQEEIHNHILNNGCDWNRQTLKSKLNFFDLVLTDDYELFYRKKAGSVYLFNEMNDEWLFENVDVEHLNVIIFWNFLLEEYKNSKKNVDICNE